MTPLRLQLFGHVRVTLPGRSTEARLGRAARSLLAYLLLDRRHLHSREALRGVFWGDATEERARSCLSTALWRLRQTLEPTGVPRGTHLLTTPAGEVGFNAGSPHWLDVAEFEEVARQVTARPFHSASAGEAARLEGALALCTGDLLEGFYEEWALAERERLRRLHLESLSWLMRYQGFYGGYDRAIALGQEVLRREPAREEVHREVMRLYLETGQRSLAARQYELCRGAVRRHLGSEPTPETRALYEGAVRGAGLSGVRPSGAFDGLVDRLDAAIRRFDEARDELRQAVELVSRLTAGAGDAVVSDRGYPLSERSQVRRVSAR